MRHLSQTDFAQSKYVKGHPRMTSPKRGVQEIAIWGDFQSKTGRKWGHIIGKWSDVIYE